MAELAQLSKEEYEEYMQTLKQYDDYHNSLAYAAKQAAKVSRAEGEARGRAITREVIKRLKAGESPDGIADSLSVPVEEVLELQALLG